MLHLSPAHPFRAKGIVYQRAREHYDAHVPGGMAAVVAALDPEHQRFFDNIQLGAAWYDLQPLVPLAGAAARLCGQSLEALVEANAREMAERDISGTYRFLFRVLAPSFVAPRLPRLALRYFQLGDVVVTEQTEQRLVAELTSVPRSFRAWLGSATRAFVGTALQIAGATTVDVRGPEVVEGPTVSDVPTVTLRFTIEWG